MQKSMRMAIVLPSLNYYKSRVGNYQPLFEECGLPVEYLHEPNYRIPVAQWDRLLAGIKKDLNLPHLGLLAGDKFELRNYGLLGFLLANCSNVQEGFDLSARYYAYLSSPPSPRLIRKNQKIIVQHNISTGPADERKTRAEMFVCAIQRFAQLLSFNKLRIKEIHFEHSEPAYADMYKDSYPGCEVFFAAEKTCLVFAEEDMEIALDFPSEDIKLKIQRELDAILGAELDSSYSGKIETLLISQDQGFTFNLSMQEIASLLNMGTKTLSRRLAEEETTFSQLHEKIRSKSAQKLLRNSEYKVDHIALELGFTDRSSFERAFKRWFGKTPSQYRKTINKS